MSRTRLIDVLRRAYRICRISAVAKIPQDEVEGYLTESLTDRLSRRQVLRGLSLGGVAALSPLIQPPSQLQVQSLRRATFAQAPAGQLTDAKSTDTKFSDAKFSDSKVLVVGAGISGLTVAYRLRQHGIAVEVVEASPRVGGRLRSMVDSANNLGVVELGGEFIDSRHTTVRSLAAELGLEMADLRAADEGLEPEILYFQGRKISHSWVAEEFIPLARRIAADVEALTGWNLTYRDPNPVAAKLDRLSLADYLSLTPVHPVIENLVRVAYVTEYGLDAEAQSCLNLLFLIGADVGKWSTYGNSDERYHVVGGNELIPRRLAERLAGLVETNTSLESIRMTSEGQYRVSLRQDAVSSERVYDQIVLTVPFTVLRQVELAVGMSPEKRAAIDELGYGTSSKLSIPFKERIWRTDYGSTISVYTDQPFQNTWESARYSPGPGGWVTDLRGGRAGVALGNSSSQYHADALVQDLECLFPGLSQVDRGSAIRSIWATNPYVFGSYSCYLPGQWTRFGGAEIERVGNIWFAGEHCSIGSQGYMDGACETAERAARSLLAQINA